MNETEKEFVQALGIKPGDQIFVLQPLFAGKAEADRRVLISPLDGPEGATKKALDHIREDYLARYEDEHTFFATHVQCDGECGYESDLALIASVAADGDLEFGAAVYGEWLVRLSWPNNGQGETWSFFVTTPSEIGE